MKKGAIRTVVFLILALIGAGILILGIIQWQKQLEEGKVFDVETCRASVVMTSVSKTATGEPWLSLKCSTRKRELNVEDRGEIIITLVEDMKEAWYQYGSGKIDFTSNWDWAKSHQYCFISSVLNFDKESKKITKEEFYPYISKLTFLDNLIVGNINSNFELDETLKIIPDEPIFVVYGIAKEPAKGLWGTIKALIYKSGHFPTLIVTNKNSIKNICSESYVDSKKA